MLVLRVKDSGHIWGHLVPKETNAHVGTLSAEILFSNSNQSIYQKDQPIIEVPKIALWSDDQST